MARRSVIGDDRRGPVAENVDARAVHRSLSWFKSRPGLQPSLLRSFGWQASRGAAKAARHSSKGDGGLQRQWRAPPRFRTDDPYLFDEFKWPKCRLTGPV